MQCPFYQGVCMLNEHFICYSNKDSCDIYKDWLEENKTTDQMERWEKASEARSKQYK